MPVTLVEVFLVQTPSSLYKHLLYANDDLSACMYSTLVETS